MMWKSFGFRGLCTDVELGRNKTKRAKSLHRFKFGLHIWPVLIRQVYAGFTYGCRRVYSGHSVVHRSERWRGGRGCEPLFLWAVAILIFIEIIPYGYYLVYLCR